MAYLGPTLKKFVYLILAFFSLALPLCLKIKYESIHIASIALFYLLNLVSASYLVRKHLNKTYNLQSERGNIQERINILIDGNIKESGINSSLKKKIARYNSLKQVVEELNERLDLNSVAEKLSGWAFGLISANQGVCILYLVDNRTQRLGIFKAKKEDAELIIREKEGDIFDFWILKHAHPLLIEDIKQDFRFDLHKLQSTWQRPISSLVSCPLASDSKFLGILRLDSAKEHNFTQDDLRFLATICDLGAVAIENSQLFQKTQDLAIHDELTMLYTKAYFLERLRQECSRSRRKNAPFSLLMLDIDFFKNYNDEFGHIAGDIVLKNISSLINENLNKPGYLACRFGGEEFCIMLEGMDKDKACFAAEALRKRIEKAKIILRRRQTSVTVSTGVASFPAHGDEADTLVQKADRAMYEAKQRGRNQVCCA